MSREKVQLSREAVGQTIPSGSGRDQINVIKHLAVECSVLAA